MVNSTRNSQRGQTCMIVGCSEKGRVIGKLGKALELCYCPKHRKYGVRILNAMINSVFNYKLTNFLVEVRKDMYSPKNIFCDECNAKLKTFVKDKSNELNNLLDYAEKNDIEEYIQELTNDDVDEKQVQ